MTRETDSSSSGPQGRGGAAYPSGTPPYGSRPFPSLHPQERTRPAGAPDEGPGSQDAAPDAAAAPAPDEPRTETTLTTRIRINIPGSRPIPPVVVRTTVDDSNTPAAAAEEAQPAPAPEAEAPAEPEAEKTSDWFAPRKTQAPSPESGAPAGAPATPFGRDESTASTPYLPPPVGAAPDDGAAARGPHDTPAGGFATPFATEAPPFGAGSPFDTGARPAADGGRSPYDTGPQPFGTGDFPPGVPRPSEQPFPGTEDGHPPSGTDPLGIPYAASPPFGDEIVPPRGATTGPATGTINVPPLTPDPAQPPARPSAFRQPAPGPRGGDRVSGDTLVGGIPAVPPGASRPPRAPRPPAVPEPAPAPAAAARPAKKGRSKPVLLGVAAGGVLILAYGAGLLMNHADVPKGTTVLGVDIGNQKRDAAVKMLDTALGNRTTAPISLTIGGHRQSLKPSVAGLSVDTDATVREVAHADYNPVSVIGSLFGGSRTADPVFVADEDKLKVALQTLAGKDSAGTDAMVRFADGKAIGVPGEARQTFDVTAAAAQVEAAYRTRAETGADTAVVLTTTTAPPRVSQAELDKAVNGFGKTAMSGLVTVRANAAQHISFSPTKSLPKFLTMVATPGGKLAPHIDLDKLKALYGGTFNGVLLERSDGSKTAVTPQDVATALIQALRGTGTGRTVTFPNLAH